MASILEVPLRPSTPQKFHISLGGTDYTLWLSFNTHANAGAGLWVLQIGDTNERILVSGIPLVPGGDLLEQFRYLGVPGSLVCQGAGNPQNVPTFTDLGSGSHLFFIL